MSALRSFPWIPILGACLLAAACGRRPTSVNVEPEPGDAATHSDASTGPGSTPNPAPPAPRRIEPPPPTTPGPIECQTDEACPDGTFCLLPDGCGAANGQGTCTPPAVPELCPDWSHCPEICGCDGQTYCDRCEAHAAGVNVDYDGRCCDELAAAYRAAVNTAKQCCANCDEETCSVFVTSDLICGCETVVSFDPAWRVQELQRLAQRWADQRCAERGLWNCPGVECPAVGTGSCQPTAAGGGRCADVLPD